MNRWIRVAAMVLLTIATVVFAVLWRQAGERCDELHDERQHLSETVRRSEILHHSLRDSLRVLRMSVSQEESMRSFWYRQARKAQENQAMLLSDSDIKSLQKMGLIDPVKQLREDLAQHPELIPYEGTLGGTMRFIDDRIALLSDRWVFAQFEDGHIMGSCLLEYEVTREAKISWKLLRSELN